MESDISKYMMYLNYNYRYIIYNYIGSRNAIEKCKAEILNSLGTVCI